jgi:hypothetical protein
MKRANRFDVIPQSDEDEELLRPLLDASAALWNEINYERRLGLSSRSVLFSPADVTSAA